MLALLGRITWALGSQRRLIRRVAALCLVVMGVHLAADHLDDLAYHLIDALDPNSKLRPLVVPKPSASAQVVKEGTPPDGPRLRPSPSPYRLDWASALRRVFGFDILACARCGGRLVVLAFIEKLTAVKAIPDHLGLPSAPLPLGKARGPPQVAWDF